MCVFCVYLHCRRHNRRVPALKVQTIMEDNGKRKKGGMSYATCLALGMLLGVSIGSATDNLGTWMAIGMLFGVAYYDMARGRKSDGGDD